MTLLEFIVQAYPTNPDQHPKYFLLFNYLLLSKKNKPEDKLPLAAELLGVGEDALDKNIDLTYEQLLEKIKPCAAELLGIKKEVLDEIFDVAYNELLKILDVKDKNIDFTYNQLLEKIKPSAAEFLGVSEDASDEIIDVACKKLIEKILVSPLVLKVSTHFEDPVNILLEQAKQVLQDAKMCNGLREAIADSEKPVASQKTLPPVVYKQTAISSVLGQSAPKKKIPGKTDTHQHLQEAKMLNRHRLNAAIADSEKPISAPVHKRVAISGFLAKSAPKKKIHGKKDSLPALTLEAMAEEYDYILIQITPLVQQINADLAKLRADLSLIDAIDYDKWAFTSKKINLVNQAVQDYLRFYVLLMYEIKSLEINSPKLHLKAIKSNLNSRLESLKKLGNNLLTTLESQLPSPDMNTYKGLNYSIQTSVTISILFFAGAGAGVGGTVGLPFALIGALPAAAGGAVAGGVIGLFIGLVICAYFYFRSLVEKKNLQQNETPSVAGSTTLSETPSEVSSAVHSEVSSEIPSEVHSEVHSEAHSEALQAAPLPKAKTELEKSKTEIERINSTLASRIEKLKPPAPRIPTPS